MTIIELLRSSKRLANCALEASRSESQLVSAGSNVARGSTGVACAEAVSASAASDEASAAAAVRRTRGRRWGVAVRCIVVAFRSGLLISQPRRGVATYGRRVNYVVRVSKSRAKRKRSSAHEPRRRATGPRRASGTRRWRRRRGEAREGAAGAKAARGARASGAKASGGAGRGAGAKARGGAAADAAARRRAAARPAVAARRPEPIWAPFPLTEIGMGVGIVIFGVGYVTSSPWLVAIGALVLAVVVAELCLREHFAGFRSHALLLAALTVVAAHSLVFAISGRLPRSRRARRRPRGRRRARMVAARTLPRCPRTRRHGQVRRGADAEV